MTGYVYVRVKLPLIRTEIVPFCILVHFINSENFCDVIVYKNF